MIAANLATKASEHTLNHLSVVLCNQAGMRGDGFPWHCGLTWAGALVDESPLVNGPVCQEVSNYLIYLDTKFPVGVNHVSMPRGTGIPIGGSTGYNSIVLTSHYPSRQHLTNGFTDESGVKLTLTKEDKKKVGAVEVYVWGFIEANRTGEVVGSYTLDQDVKLHLISGYGHGHDLSLLATMWKVDGRNGRRTLLLQQEPRVEHFYKEIDSSVVLVKGDQLLFRCVFENKSPEEVEIRNTDMCIFPLIYYVEGDHLLTPKIIYTYDRRQEQEFRGRAPLDPSSKVVLH